MTLIATLSPPALSTQQSPVPATRPDAAVSFDALLDSVKPGAATLGEAEGTGEVGTDIPAPSERASLTLLVLDDTPVCELLLNAAGTEQMKWRSEGETLPETASRDGTVLPPPGIVLPSAPLPPAPAPQAVAEDGRRPGPGSHSMHRFPVAAMKHPANGAQANPATQLNASVSQPANIEPSTQPDYRASPSDTAAIADAEPAVDGTEAPVAQDVPARPLSVQPTVLTAPATHPFDRSPQPALSLSAMRAAPDLGARIGEAVDALQASGETRPARVVLDLERFGMVDLHLSRAEAGGLDLRFAAPTTELRAVLADSVAQRRLIEAAALAQPETARAAPGVNTYDRVKQQEARSGEEDRASRGRDGREHAGQHGAGDKRRRGQRSFA